MESLLLKIFGESVQSIIVVLFLLLCIWITKEFITILTNVRNATKVDLSSKITKLNQLLNTLLVYKMNNENDIKNSLLAIISIDSLLEKETKIELIKSVSNGEKESLDNLITKIEHKLEDLQAKYDELHVDPRKPWYIIKIARLHILPYFTTFGFSVFFMLNVIGIIFLVSQKEYKALGFYFLTTIIATLYISLIAVVIGIFIGLLYLGVNKLLNWILQKKEKNGDEQ